MNPNNILYLGTNPEKYATLGHIVHFPMIEISANDLDEQTAQSLKAKWDQYAMVIFTSRFAVEYFFKFMDNKGLDRGPLGQMQRVVIGEHTADALKQYGAEPTLIADEETSQGVLEALKQQGELAGKSVLLPRSNLPNPFLKDALGAMGCEVDEIAIYQNTKPPKRDWPNQSIDAVMFTSPSTVKNFLADYAEIPKKWKIISKGPLTQQTLEEAGFKSEVVNG